MPSHIRKEIEHKFQVSQLDSFKTDERYEGDKVSVTHNGTPIWFQLLVKPADSRHRTTNKMGVYLKYVDGPQGSISIRFSLYVMGKKRKTCIFATNPLWHPNPLWITIGRGQSVGAAKATYRQLPRRLTDLESKGYIKQDGTILISADVYISLDAFEQPSSLQRSTSSVSGSSEYICQDLNQSLAPKTNPTPIPEATAEEKLAIAIQESEEEEKERQRQLDLFRIYNGPDFGSGQRLSDTELNESLKDGLVTGESTNKPPTPTTEPKLYPSLTMKEELREQKQKDMAGSGALSTPVDAQQTVESPLNNGAQTNDQFALGLREQINAFTNRLMSNQTHGRSIVNDSMIETLFVSLTSQHGALLERMQTLGDKRVHYCWLQERMAEIGELRRALDELRNEEKRKKQIHKQVIIQHKLTQLRTHKHQMLEQRRMLALQRFQHQQIQYGQEPMSNFGVWPQFGLGMPQSQRTPSYNPSHTISQQPMIMQQYSNSHYAYPSPQYLNATAPPQMCPQMPGADQQGNNTNQPNVGLLIDL